MRVESASFHENIRSIANCPSLVQLGLIVHNVDLKVGKLMDVCKWAEAEFTDFFVDLVQNLPKLIALLVVIPGASQLHCCNATAALKKKFQPSRPCFCVHITDTLVNSCSSCLPSVHYHSLVVEPHLLVGELPFHLIPSDNRY